jgi:hypothetical protein
MARLEEEEPWSGRCEGRTRAAACAGFDKHAVRKMRGNSKPGSVHANYDRIAILDQFHLSPDAQAEGFEPFHDVPFRLDPPDHCAHLWLQISETNQRIGNWVGVCHHAIPPYASGC